MFGLMPKYNNIYVYNTHMELPNYKLGECKSLEEELSTWNKMTFSFVAKGYYYDAKEERLLIPRAFNIQRVEVLTNRSAEMISYKGDISRIAMGQTAPPRDEIQEKGIQFLLGIGEYSRYSKYSQLVLNLPPGKGKTFMAIAAIANYKQKAAVIVHNSELLEQWKQSFLKFTNLLEEDIIILQGHTSIDKIMNTPDRNVPGKIYIISHRTLSSYGDHHEYTALDDLFKKIKIGIKVFDEAHLEFLNMVKIDTHTNVKRTFYLTATFDRSDIQESIIFKKCFFAIPKYTMGQLEEKVRHLVHVTCKYNTHPTRGDEFRMKNKHGFDKNAFSDYSIEQPGYYSTINKLLEQFISKTTGLHLVLVAKIDACKLVGDSIQEAFPDKSVLVYNSTTSKKDKADLENYDIIVSTDKSLGTGKDMPGLRSVISTSPYSSRVMAEQVSGRLRPHRDGGGTFYVETIDVGFKRPLEMLRNRMPVFKAKCIKLSIINME